jgi:hypothetical protein
MVNDINLASPRDLSLAIGGPRGFESELFIILAGNPFSPSSDPHASTTIFPRTARLSLKKFLDDKPVFHLEILQNIILKVFPYLNDGFISDLLRSCPRVPVLQIMMITEAGLRSSPRVLALQWLTNNLTVW